MGNFIYNNPLQTMQFIVVIAGIVYSRMIYLFEVGFPSGFV